MKSDKKKTTKIVKMNVYGRDGKGANDAGNRKWFQDNRIGGYHSSNPPEGKDGRDPALEDPERRQKIPRGGGDICISFQPGEEYIGEVGVTFQFEGPKREGMEADLVRDECMKGHNDLAVAGMKELVGFLEEIQMEADLEVEITACPYSKEPPAVVEIAKAVENTEGVKSAVENTEGVKSTVGPIIVPVDVKSDIRR